MNAVSPPRPAPQIRRRPTVRELPADLLTPVGAFLRLRARGPAFLLESVERGQQVGRYSFLAAGCKAVPLDAAPGADLFAPLREALGEHADVDSSGLPPFVGGAVGYLAYDAVRRFEPTVQLPERRDGFRPGLEGLLGLEFPLVDDGFVSVFAEGQGSLVSELSQVSAHVGFRIRFDRLGTGG